MFQLNSVATVYPPPYTDKDGNYIVPEPINYHILDITYIDNPVQHKYVARITGFHFPLVLWEGSEYDMVGDISKKIANIKIREKFDGNPGAVLQSLFMRTPEQNPDGVGMILSGMLKSLGIYSSPNCKCRQHAIQMNDLGPDWCENNISTILGWLKEESIKRNLPFIESIAKLMVQRAISKSRRIMVRKEQKHETS